MAKSASGDKSAAWLPGACGQARRGQQRSALGHRACSAGLPWGEVAKLAEKGAGRRKQDRVPWGGQRRKGTFRVGHGKVASVFPREEACMEDSSGHCPQNCLEPSFGIGGALSGHHTGSSPPICQVFSLQMGKLWGKGREGAESRARART